MFGTKKYILIQSGMIPDADHLRHAEEAADAAAPWPMPPSLLLFRL